MCKLVHEMHETATNNTEEQTAAVEDVDGVVMVDILDQPQESIPATQRTTRRTITQPAHDDEHSNPLCNRLLDRILEHPNISSFDARCMFIGTYDIRLCLSYDKIKHSTTKIALIEFLLRFSEAYRHDLCSLLNVTFIMSDSNNQSIKSN